MDKTLTIAGICGSLRKASYNRMALRAAGEVLPVNTTLEIVEIGALPLFNQDLEDAPPGVVLDFRTAIQNADTLLISACEYNYSVSAALKNAIEWASRPYTGAVLNRKPVALMGASTGMLGTGRAQYHLRQMLVQTDSRVLNRPEVMIPFADAKFGPDGTLVDTKTRQKIGELVGALSTWVMDMKHEVYAL